MHLTMRKPWSLEEIERLKVLYEQNGLCAEEIAELMSRSIVSVHIKRKRLRLRHTDSQTKAAKRRINLGIRNAMYGVPSWCKGLTKETDCRIANASKLLSQKRKRLFEQNLLPRYTGSSNPMYGKSGWNSGLTKQTSEKIRLAAAKTSLTCKAHWQLMSDAEKQVRIEFLTRLCHDQLKSKRIRTSIEIKVENFLRKLRVNFEPNFKIGRFVVDFYLPQCNIVIECQGDYWHANPLMYSTVDKVQSKNIDRDNRKKALLAGEGVKTLYFWETDINKHFSEVKDKIREHANQ